MFQRILLVIAGVLLVAGALLAAGAAPVKDVAPKPLPSNITLQNCLVSLIEEAEVAAQEPGVLTDVVVREGQQVAIGDPLAQIDDAKTKMEMRVAQAKLEVAREEAKNNVNVEYTTASAEVALATWNKSYQANREHPGTVPETAMLELKLKYKETTLGIEKARMDKRIAGEQAKVSQAEVDLAQENINRRKIKSPLDGKVVEIKRHKGEWVQPGDPLAHVIRLDRLRIEVMLKGADIAPSEVEGRPVVVGVELERGRKESFSGQVVFADSRVQGDGTYRVRAEVLNRRVSNNWVLLPGVPAEMTIQLK